MQLLTPGQGTQPLRSLGQGLYATTTKPTPGQSYTLQVNAEGYPGVRATDTIPALVPIREAWYSFPTG
ncbi:hypothetical protein BXP70_26210, partial [Hymenobacter crusticola]